MTRPALALALLSMAGCREPAPISVPPDQAASWTDPSPHRSGFVTTPGARIHYLDWGGSGPPLILIHGLGDNPHVFDDLVPALGGGFRIVAYARRGHGRSSKDGPYDTATLVADLRAFMDSLGIKQAHLAGWSMGGNELTALARLQPDRVNRLVYLDAGYDWADPAHVTAVQDLPADLTPKPDALESLESFKAWQGRAYFPGLADLGRLEAFFRDMVDIQPDGSVRPVASDSIAGALFAALLSSPRDYRGIRAPVLAIFASSMFDVVHADSAQLLKNQAYEARHFVPFRAASVARVRRELPQAVIVRVPGSHMDFVVTARDSVAGVIRRFLGDSTVR